MDSRGWIDLQRNRRDEEVGQETGHRKFVVLPLEGPVAEHPSMLGAAGIAKLVDAGSVGVLDAADRMKDAIRTIDADIALLSKEVVGRATERSPERSMTTP